MFTILGSWLMCGFLLPDLSMPGLKRCQGTQSCPMQGCRFVGPARALTIYWRSFHDAEVLLCLCPLPRCVFQTPKPQGFRQHWEGCHNATRYQSSQLRTLPLLADFVQSQHRIDPGSVCPPVPPVQRPLGRLPHRSKDALLVQVEGILQMPKQEKASTPGTSSLVMPLCSRSPTHTVPEECTGDTRVAVQESQVTSDDRRPSATTMDTHGIIPPTPVTMTSSSSKDSPILVQSSPSYELSLRISRLSCFYDSVHTDSAFPHVLITNLATRHYPFF